MLIGFLFVLWIIGFMAYSLWPRKVKTFNNVQTKPIRNSKIQPSTISDDGSFKLFLKTLSPIILVVVFGIILSQCEGGSVKRISSSGSGWWQTNTCGEGAKFDEFKDGRGQWRNTDGKFCSR